MVVAGAITSQITLKTTKHSAFLAVINTEWINSFNPSSPNIHIQILQTGLYTFPNKFNLFACLAFPTLKNENHCFTFFFKNLKIH